jgi:hypothetical protein
VSINPNTAFTAGQVFTADQANRFPRGVMAYATKTANQSLNTTFADITGLSVTFTAAAGRYYRYTVFFNSADGDANSANIRVTDGSAVNKYQIAVDQDGPAQFGFIILTYVSTESAGSVTRKVQGKTSTGGATLNADATNVAWMLVEDIGEA